MCSIRGLWILSAGGSVLFSKRWVVFERRARAAWAAATESSSACGPFVAIPDDLSFSSRFFEDFVATARTSFTCSLQGVEPVVVLEVGGFFYVAVPLVEDCVASRRSSRDWSDAPEVSATLTFLGCLSELCPATKLKTVDVDSLVGDAHYLLSVMMPFGTPLDTDSWNVRSLARTIPDVTTQKARPPWKPLFHSDKQRLEVLVREDIRAVQYGRATVPDEWEVSGVVLCKCELDGFPEVKLSLLPRNIFSFITVSPYTRSPVTLLSHELSFSSPLHSFELCHYGVAKSAVLDRLPIRGLYRMREVSATEAAIRLQLKLNERFTCQFESLEVYAPFHNRGAIVRIENSTVSAGSVAIHKSRHLLVWNIGQRLSQKSLEVVLAAKVHFEPEIQPEDGFVHNAFLVGMNCYVEVRFRMPGDTCSGLSVDPRNISVYPTARVLIQTKRQLSSGDYKIWNALGDVKHCLPNPETTKFFSAKTAHGPQHSN